MPSGVSYPHGTVTATTTAAFLVTAGAENDGIVIGNRGPADAFLGGSSVTADESSSAGLQLVPGEKVTLPTVGNQSADVYVVTAEGTAIVTWMEI